MRKFFSLLSPPKKHVNITPVDPALNMHPDSLAKIKHPTGMGYTTGLGVRDVPRLKSKHWKSIHKLQQNDVVTVVNGQVVDEKLM